MTDHIVTDTRIDISEVSYDHPPPRCSLDFCIHLADGSLMGDRLLRLESFQGQSQVSQLFDYQLDLRADDYYAGGYATHSPPLSLSLAKILGRPATISMLLPIAQHSTSGQAAGTPPRTYINGLVESFSMLEAGHYAASIKPALWRLTLTNDYKLYASKSIKQILYAIVKEKHQIECDIDDLDGLAAARIQDWLQAGESDFDFINRLMNKASIYYYFVHDFGKHTLVFCNRSRYRKLNQRAADGSLTDKPLSLYYTFSKVAGLEENDLIEGFSFKQNLTTSRVHSLIAEPHAAWEKDQTAELNRFSSETMEIDHQTISESETFKQYQIYQYGSKKEEAKDLAELELQKLATSASEISGQTACRELKPGYQFITRQHKTVLGKSPERLSVLELRPEFDKQAFVVTSVKESGSAEGSYKCQLQATSANGQVAHFGLHNTHMGSMLAVVTCAPDDKENPSKYLHYLDKNNFSHYSYHFDSTFAGQYKAQGVYVSFSTDEPNAPSTWVKLAEHMQTVPEVGVTVLVARSNDESEIPEIQSIVQSKGSHTINPNGAIDHTNWGDSYSTNYGDSHSIRFGKQSQVNLEQARAIISKQYDSGNFKDVSYSKGGSYSYSIADQGSAGTLSHSYSEGCTVSHFKGDLSESHSHIKHSKSTSKIALSDSESEIDTSNSHSKIKTSYSKSTIDESISDSVIDTSTNNSKINNSISDSKINTSTSISKIGSSTSHQTIGNSSNTSEIGSSNNASLTGMSNSQSATGLVTSLSATGSVNSASAIGSNIAVNAVGVSATTSATGASASASFVGANASVSVVLVESKVDFMLSGGRLKKVPSLDTRISDGIEAKLKNLDAEIIGVIKAQL